LLLSFSGKNSYEISLRRAQRVAVEKGKGVEHAIEIMSVAHCKNEIRRGEGKEITTS